MEEVTFTRRKKSEFDGCFTAIITPFKGSGINPSIDWAGYEKLIGFQDEARIAGIIPCGTTGESPTLSHKEHDKLIEVAVEKCKGLVIAGTGSNCTREAVELTKKAFDAGADASLQVCPYYNKPNQAGLFSHFSEIAKTADFPIILYNIPGRSGREIAPETMVKLARDHSNIIGVKEASGNPEVWKRIRELCGKEFVILSGNDGDTYPLMKDFGARGVISVASNVIPLEMNQFVGRGLDGRWEEMEKANGLLKEFFDTLFIDTNPIMVKEAMNLVGLPAGGLRLPLCETSGKNREQMKDLLRRMGLLKSRKAKPG
ncbi:4-hydroxy-tetrahydrodipicolinate synthase [Candidatus Micrarchaeota archaeon]|nr:4-hydroxy-tetrahydrodipicolinate synthase [Candidatus Micrarchaeota archaeon]